MLIKLVLQKYSNFVERANSPDPDSYRDEKSESPKDGLGETVSAFTTLTTATTFPTKSLALAQTIITP